MTPPQDAASLPGWSAQQARARFEARFGTKRPVILFIVPTSAEDDAVRDAARARADGADGVFLINRRIGHQELLRIAGSLARIHAGWFVGVNCRDLRPQDVFCRLPEGIGGVWTEWPESTGGWPPVVVAMHEARQLRKWNGLYFCGPKPGTSWQRLAAARTSGQLDPADVLVLERSPADLGPRQDHSPERQGTILKHPIALQVNGASCSSLSAVTPVACLMVHPEDSADLPNPETRQG